MHHSKCRNIICINNIKHYSKDEDKLNFRMINIKQHKYLSFIVATILVSSFMLPVSPATAIENQSTFNTCMQQEIRLGANDTTLGEMREQCNKKPSHDAEVANDSSLSQRLHFDKLTWDNPFSISMHKPNYVLVVSHNNKTNEAPFTKQFPSENITFDETELKFQISAKYPIATNLFGGDENLFFAYTNRSFWQMYNSNSAPFRETNHEPELFLSLKNDWQVFGFTNSIVQVGIVHQSNGRAATLSRSWNRLFASFIFEKDNMIVGFKPWYRIKEDITEDNNPDIEDYMGVFELTGVYKKNQHTFSVMVRNNLQSNNRGAIQLDWVFPLSNYLSGYIQVFDGYGESLIDYDYHQKSIGLGVTLSGWL